MCGILGVCLDKRERNDADYIEIALDFARIWEESQTRGTDAAGVYIVNRESEIRYIKAPVPSNNITDMDDDFGFWQMIRDNLGPDTIAIIGHTRAATTGAPECNDNNHPVVDAPIIGVHNGIIQNHLRLNAKYPKCAEVDSAAIMSLLKAKAGDKPLTMGVVAGSLHELDGSFAIAVADMRKPDGIFLARNRSPVSFVRNRADGILMFASTADILRRALGDGIHTFAMPADTVCRISRKTIRGSLAFKPLKAAKPTTKPSATVIASKPVKGPRYWQAQRDQQHVANASPTCRCRPCRDAAITNVDDGLRCSTCHQLYLMVYHGNVEQRCCNCNPYGGF